MRIGLGLPGSVILVLINVQGYGAFIENLHLVFHDLMLLLAGAALLLRGLLLSGWERKSAQGRVARVEVVSVEVAALLCLALRHSAIGVAGLGFFAGQRVFDFQKGAERIGLKNERELQQLRQVVAQLLLSLLRGNFLPEFGDLGRQLRQGGFLLQLEVTVPDLERRVQLVELRVPFLQHEKVIDLVCAVQLLNQVLVDREGLLVRIKLQVVAQDFDLEPAVQLEILDVFHGDAVKVRLGVVQELEQLRAVVDFFIQQSAQIELDALDALQQVLFAELHLLGWKHGQLQLEQRFELLVQVIEVLVPLSNHRPRVDDVLLVEHGLGDVQLDDLDIEIVVVLELDVLDDADIEELQTLLQLERELVLIGKVHLRLTSLRDESLKADLRGRLLLAGAAIVHDPGLRISDQIDSATVPDLLVQVVEMGLLAFSGQKRFFRALRQEHFLVVLRNAQKQKKDRVVEFQVRAEGVHEFLKHLNILIEVRERGQVLERRLQVKCDLAGEILAFLLLRELLDQNLLQLEKLGYVMRDIVQLSVLDIYQHLYIDIDVVVLPDQLDILVDLNCNGRVRARIFNHKSLCLNNIY